MKINELAEELLPQHFLKQELMRARLEVFENQSGGVGVDLLIKDIDFNGIREPRSSVCIIKIPTGKYHDLYLQPINLEKDRSVKISKQDLGEPKENLWIALVLFMKEMEPTLYLIPSKKLNEPDDYIFIDNEQGERFQHLSNWEIKVFPKAIPELAKYSINHMIENVR